MRYRATLLLVAVVFGKLLQVAPHGISFSGSKKESNSVMESFSYVKKDSYRPGSYFIELRFQKNTWNGT